MPFRPFAVVLSAALLGALALPAIAQQAYQKPPDAILQLTEAENPPLPLLDGRGRWLALLRRPAFLALGDLAQPELRLAGLRLNPATHNQARTRPFAGLDLQEVATGRALALKGLPTPLALEYPQFSPTGEHLAFVEVQAGGLALWVVATATGEARRLTEPTLSAVLGRPFQWAADGRALYIHARPSLEPFAGTAVLPSGPAVQEATGVKAPGRTYQDLLKSPRDEAQFSHYARSRVLRVDLQGQAAQVLPPGLYRGLQPSPDGRFLLVTEILPPFSYQFQLDRFPSRTLIVDASGARVALLAEKPLQDRIPVDFDACEPGRRQFGWRADAPATVTWVEALDGGDPSRPVAERDAVHQWEAPFQGTPTLLFRTRYRFAEIRWGHGRLAVASDGWWKTRRTRTYRVDPGAPSAEPHLIGDRASEDAYADPGRFVTAPNAFNREVLRLGDGGRTLYLEGEGCTPEGNRPFLDAFDLASGTTRRLWQADGKATFESILRVLDPEGGRLLTQVEGPTTFPNLFLRTLGRKGGLQPVTRIPNPFKVLEGVTRRTLHYKRADGVELSATLLLPPGYDASQAGRLPVLLHAYPAEFKDPATAGQLRESPHRFVRPGYGGPVFWALRGYAVLENTQFPIVGQGKAEPNDTYLEQLVANAKAAIDEVDRLGVGDPRRVACIGHSYGAFMVANLLAHSDLFAAGIARSGAYNRTLTPFGFQAEERTYWQAMDTYQKMSPFNYAGNIKAPLLLIHGDADNNPGTFTLQSERLFQAIKGLGGRARLVLLPLESHGYAARENILHMLWEQDAWLEQHVKRAKP